MLAINKQTYRSTVLTLLKYSNNIAVVMVLIAIYVCFSANVWYYVAILGLSSAYLSWLTAQYVSSESEQCQWQMRSLQYDCQVATFNSRLSIVSNVAVSIFGLAFAVLLSKSIIKNGASGIITDQFEFMRAAYGLGFIKLMMMYVIGDKIHTSQLIISILYKYSLAMRHLIIELPTDATNNRYPVIFLDGNKISGSRYLVNEGIGIVGVTFTPPLSLTKNSVIEYDFVNEDVDHVVGTGDMCDESDQLSCLFKCRAIIKRASSKTKSAYQEIVE